MRTQKRKDLTRRLLDHVLQQGGNPVSDTNVKKWLMVDCPEFSREWREHVIEYLRGGNSPSTEVDRDLFLSNMHEMFLNEKASEVLAALQMLLDKDGPLTSAEKKNLTPILQIGYEMLMLNTDKLERTRDAAVEIGRDDTGKVRKKARDLTTEIQPEQIQRGFGKTAFSANQDWRSFSKGRELYAQLLNELGIPIPGQGRNRGG